MKPRYQIGFDNAGVTADIIQRNPDYVPVIDTKGPFAWGSVVCICVRLRIAEKIAALLNAGDMP